MTTRRSLLCAVALGLSIFAFFAGEVAAQRGRGDVPKKAPSIYADTQGVPCPNEACGKLIEFPEGSPPDVCPHCGKKIKIEKRDDGYRATLTEKGALAKWLG